MRKPVHQVLVVIHLEACENVPEITTEVAQESETNQFDGNMPGPIDMVDE
jgi:hypothetical protein